MAYDWEQDEEDAKYAPPPPPVPGAVSPVVASSATPTYAAPAFSGQVQSGSGFIPLQQYVDTNPTQASQMVDRLVGDVGGAAKKAQTDTQNSVRTFNQQVTAGTPTSGTYAPGASPSYAPPPVGSSPGVTPSTPGARPVYSGPSAWDADGANTKATQEAQEKVNQTQNFQGQQALLQDTYGKGQSYTSGQSRLDAALTGAYGGEKFQNLWNQYGDNKVQATLDQAREQTGNAVSRAQQAADRLASQWDTERDAAVTAESLKRKDSEYYNSVIDDPDYKMATMQMSAGGFNVIPPQVQAAFMQRLADKYGPDWQQKMFRIASKYNVNPTAHQRMA